jgi:hypothetical protein
MSLPDWISVTPVIWIKWLIKVSDPHPFTSIYIQPAEHVMDVKDAYYLLCPPGLLLLVTKWPVAGYLVHTYIHTYIGWVFLPTS